MSCRQFKNFDKSLSALYPATWLILFTLCCLNLAEAQVRDTNSQSEACSFNWQAMMALDEKAFDQDMNGGWRRLARLSDCYLAAANLINDYRDFHQSESTTLAWHEGQLRANLGETEHAIVLFNLARHTNDLTGWNDYVDATIAFLRRDLQALHSAREALAAVPKPDARWTDSQGNTIDIVWPLNLDVVDRLIRCYDFDYETAYGRCPVEE